MTQLASSVPLQHTIHTYIDSVADVAKRVDSRGDVSGHTHLRIKPQPTHGPKVSLLLRQLSCISYHTTHRFFNLVLLPRVRDDLAEYKRLNFQLFMSLKKAIFKPAAFFKGILLPICEVCVCVYVCMCVWPVCVYIHLLRILVFFPNTIFDR